MARPWKIGSTKITAAPIIAASAVSRIGLNRVAPASIKMSIVTFRSGSAWRMKSISKIEEAILNALETTPPELSADIYKTGIYMAGGGALLRGLDKRISIKTKLPVHVAEDPLRAVVRGTGLALKNRDRYTFLMS